MSQRKYVCPACRQEAGVYILYGLPTEEAIEMAERNEIALGGCCIEEDGPDHKCTQCGHEWRINAGESGVE